MLEILYLGSVRGDLRSILLKNSEIGLGEKS